MNVVVEFHRETQFLTILSFAGWDACCSAFLKFILFFHRSDFKLPCHIDINNPQ